MGAMPAADPNGRKLALIRFALRAVRVSASTIAVVALLRQEWVAGAAFAVAWLLILGAPRLFPALQERERPWAGRAQAVPRSQS